MKKKIFFVSYGAGHIAMMVPVLRALYATAEFEITCLALTTAGSRLEKEGIPYVGYRDFYWEYGGGARADELGRALLAELPPGAVSEVESRAYLGSNYFELEERFGPDGARERYGVAGRHAFFPVNFMKRLLGHLQPDLVVATNSPRSERAAIVAAGELGISAICLVDLFALQEGAWIGQPGYANKICVLSEKVKKMFVGLGRKPSEIVVTGNPAFDALSSAVHRHSGERIRDARGWNHEVKVVLYASQVEPEKHPFAERKGDTDLPRKIERYLIDMKKKYQHMHLVLRPHPSEQVEYGTLPDGVSVSPATEPLAPLLHAIDAAVVTASTVGLEAAIVGKPVVSVDMSVFTSDAPYSQMGISFGVDSIEGIEGVLLTALKGARPVSVVPDDGRATERVLEEIRSML